MKKLLLVDAALCGQNTPAPTTDTPDAPGALLPPDFPRHGLSADQLVELEEWYLTHAHTAIQRIFALLHTTRNGERPTPNSILHAIAVLAKLLGLNTEMSWRELATALGTSAPSLCQLKQSIAARLATFATYPTPAELHHASRILTRTARRARLLAAILAQ